MAEGLLVALAKAVPVVFKGWRRYRRIAKARMPFRIGRTASGDVAPRRLDSVMKAVPGNLRP